jgi:hypothetical protein
VTGTHAPCINDSASIIRGLELFVPRSLGTLEREEWAVNTRVGRDIARLEVNVGPSQTQIMGQHGELLRVKYMLSKATAKSGIRDGKLV